MRAAELEHDNDDKIAGLAEAQASAARELARLDGVAPDSPEEAALLNGARSQILRAAIWGSDREKSACRYCAGPLTRTKPARVMHSS